MKFNYQDMLNQYLTNIFLLKHNLATLYFNLKGEGSDNFKNALRKDLDSFSKIYLDLAILIKKIGGYPIMNLEEIKNISTIKEISSKDYTPKEAASLLLNDLKVVNSMNNQVGEYALKNYDLRSINLLLEFNQYLQNRIFSLQINN